MRLTKFGHACVRVEHDGVVVVIDPGAFTSPEAVDGADAVLVTHEHPDHLYADHLRRADAPIWTIEAVKASLPDELQSQVNVVHPQDTFDVGFDVTVVGELHAVIHPDYDRFDNSGFVLESGGTSVYHPGDALTAPGRAVDVLLAPVSAAPMSLAIHDRVYSDIGLDMVAAHMATLLPRGQQFERRESGQDL